MDYFGLLKECKKYSTSDYENAYVLDHLKEFNDELIIDDGMHIALLGKNNSLLMTTQQKWAIKFRDLTDSLVSMNDFVYSYAEFMYFYEGHRNKNASKMGVASLHDDLRNLIIEYHKHLVIAKFNDDKVSIKPRDVVIARPMQSLEMKD